VNKNERKQMVGILAYGSLIDRPGPEIEEVRVRTIENVTTPFAVEYARSSRSRSGAPTLVPHDNGSPVQAHVIVVDTTVDDAADRLWRREIDAIGSGRRYVHSEIPGRNTVVVERFAGRFGLDVVLSTRIEATIRNLNATMLADLAIASVAGAKEGRDGISYLMNAMRHGVETPLTRAYAAEILRRTETDDLAAALEEVRADL
jgi:cation transport regulator ChaC